MRALVAVALLAACGRGTSTPAPVATGEALLAPWIAVTFGEPATAVVARRPTLEPAGPSTFVDATITVEANAGDVAEVAVTIVGDDAVAARRDLASRLGPGLDCGPPHLQGLYLPRFWKLADGTAVTLLDKDKALTLRAARPAPAAFVEAYATCERALTAPADGAR